MEKTNFKIQFTEEENQTLESLKDFFQFKTKSKVIHHLIELSKKRYLE